MSAELSTAALAEYRKKVEEHNVKEMKVAHRVKDIADLYDGSEENLKVATDALDEYLINELGLKKGEVEFESKAIPFRRLISNKLLEANGIAAEPDVRLEQGEITLEQLSEMKDTSVEEADLLDKTSDYIAGLIPDLIEHIFDNKDTKAIEKAYVETRILLKQSLDDEKIYGSPLADKKRKQIISNFDALYNAFAGRKANTNETVFDPDKSKYLKERFRVNMGIIEAKQRKERKEREKAKVEDSEKAAV